MKFLIAFVLLFFLSTLSYAAPPPPQRFSAELAPCAFNLRGVRFGVVPPADPAPAPKVRPRPHAPAEPVHA